MQKEFVDSIEEFVRAALRANINIVLKAILVVIVIGVCITLFQLFLFKSFTVK